MTTKPTRLWERLLLAAFLWLLERRATSRTITGSRYIVVVPDVIPHTEWSLTVRDTRTPDVYGREEVYAMLCLVRENEARLRWRCPEPVETTWSPKTH